MVQRKTPKLQKVSVELQKELRARTPNQESYITTVSENSITLVSGVAGTGKTFIAVGLACEYLERGEVDQLIFSRSIVGCGTGIAALPGNVEEKTCHYMIPMLECLEFFLGKDQARQLIRAEIIKFVPVELMRGMSIRNTFMVVDEASNLNLMQLKMVLGRIDHGSKFVLVGDYKQTDLKKCDYKDVVNKLVNINDVGFAQLNKEDIQRKKLIGDIMERLEE